MSDELLTADVTTQDDDRCLVAELRALVAENRSPWRDANGIADYLAVKPKTVQNLTGPNVADPIPFHRLTPGGEKRFHLAEVDEWLRRRS
jgi:hypothetical protein